jgi:hypothetical protein
MKHHFSGTFFAWIALSLMVPTVSNAFDVDFSRRTKKIEAHELGRNVKESEVLGSADFLSTTRQGQEIVILNTDKGFVPKSVKLEKDKAYTFYVVNVNEKSKNISFVMDSFAQYHSTYFGQIKSFEVKPRHEGVFTFQCPETSAEGRVVIYKGNSVPDRGLASEE